MIDLPDALYRQIKAQAALEGRPAKSLVHSLLQRALAAGLADSVPAARSAPTGLSIGRQLPLRHPSNAALFELLDDAVGRRNGRRPAGRQRLAGTCRARTSLLPGRLLTDTYLATFAIAAGLRLVSFDADFQRFESLNCLPLPAPDT